MKWFWTVIWLPMISGNEWGSSFADFFFTIEEKPQPGKLTRPEIEPGPARWQASMLSLDLSGGHSTSWYAAYVPLFLRNIRIGGPLFAILQWEQALLLLLGTRLWGLPSVVHCYLQSERFRVLRSLSVRISSGMFTLSQCPSIFHLRRSNATVDLGMCNFAATALPGSPLWWQPTIMPLTKSDGCSIAFWYIVYYPDIRWELRAVVMSVEFATKEHG